MKKIFLILLVCLLLKTVGSQAQLAGCYVGLGEMCYIKDGGKKECYIDPAKPREKWYHLTYIKINGDSVVVAQYPIGIYKKDTVYSESDGAFYYYKGKIKSHDKIVAIDLIMTHCDYCGIPIDSLKREKWSHKAWVGQVCDQGIMINGYLLSLRLIPSIVGEKNRMVNSTGSYCPGPAPTKLTRPNVNQSTFKS